MAVAVAEETGRRRAMALRAVKLLQYAAVDCLPEDQAVAHAVRLLRGPRPAALPRVWLGMPGLWAQRWLTGIGDPR